MTNKEEESFLNVAKIGEIETEEMVSLRTKQRKDKEMGR